jgi:hypothetical protein
VEARSCSWRVAFHVAALDSVSLLELRVFKYECTD